MDAITAASGQASFIMQVMLQAQEAQGRALLQLLDVVKATEMVQSAPLGMLGVGGNVDILV